eukprot:2489352-Rhodomonas_salina.1
MGKRLQIFYLVAASLHQPAIFRALPIPSIKKYLYTVIDDHRLYRQSDYEQYCRYQSGTRSRCPRAACSPLLGTPTQVRENLAVGIPTGSRPKERTTACRLTPPTLASLSAPAGTR